MFEWILDAQRFSGRSVGEAVGRRIHDPARNYRRSVILTIFIAGDSLDGDTSALDRS